MKTSQRWDCPTCGISVTTPFCPTCGEHEFHTRELKLRALFTQLFSAFTSIDSRLLRSFRFLVSQPGSLTTAYLKGQRKPYLGPIALFLLINVLFFATESLTGGKVFTTPLESHLQTQPWSLAIQDLVASRLESKHTTLASYEPVFDQAVALKARSFIIIMALFFALVPAVAFLRSKRPFVAHAIFSLHFYAFLLLLLCVATTIPVISVWLGGPGLASPIVDYPISIGLLMASAIYLYFSVGAVYGSRGWVRILQVSVLTVGVAAIVLGYRFFLFVVTLYTV